MPHGGYHGEVRIGNKVVQRASRSDAKGGQTGGGRYRAEGYNKKPKKKDLDIINEQAKRLREIKATPGIDNRSLFLASQTPKAMIADAQQRRIQAANQRRLAERLATGRNVSRSEFTGNLGDKSFLGINMGSTTTGKPKIREGMTSNEYADYMRGLYSIAPERMEGLFPVASGAAVRNAMKFAPIIGPLTRMAGAAKEKGKGIFSGMQNKMSEMFSKAADSGIVQDLKNAPGGFVSDFKNMFGIGKKEGATTETAPQRAEPYDASGLEGYRDAIMRMNQAVSPLSQEFYGGRSPIDEAYAGLPSTKFGREFLERMGPREGFNTVEQPVTTNQVSPNKSNVNMLTLLSPTLEDFRQNMAGTEPYEQPVLDFAMNRAPSSYNQTLEMLQNKYPGRSPMEYVTMMDQLQKTPNFQRTLAFNENFLPSANTPIQFAEGGSVGNFNLLKETNDEMHG